MFANNKSGLLVVALLSIGSFSNVTVSQEKSKQETFEDCLVNQINKAPGSRPISEVETLCREEAIKAEMQLEKIGIIGRKMIEEKQTEWNRHVILGHKQNYVLPVAHTNKPNKEPYIALGPEAEDFRNNEAIFQVSYKIPLNSGDLFRKYDSLHFGITIKSWWQVYSSESSSPFRETNYQPEFFYTAPLKTNFLGGNWGFSLGFEHQSNGRSQFLSRSWNRLYASLLYERENFALVMRPWYRLPEKSKRSPLEAQGDDNPDIDLYMGNFELTSVNRFGNNELSILLRNNLRGENRGAIEMGYSFPLPKRPHVKGFIYYFNGYGESLIDYNHQQERIGVGLLLTDFL